MRLLAFLRPLPLAALLLASCGGPGGQTEPATLPASTAARDSVKTSLLAPAPDAASTAADSARTTVTPR